MHYYYYLQKHLFSFTRKYLKIRETDDPFLVIALRDNFLLGTVARNSDMICS